VALLQRLAAARAGEASVCYAEVGVFQGLTMLSVALAAPGLACIGIDDFSILDPKGENLAVVPPARKSACTSSTARTTIAASSWG
jgi:hypothetical protein